MDTYEAQCVFCASIRLRNGKRIFAWQYGLKAFRIKVKRRDPVQPRLPGL